MKIVIIEHLSLWVLWVASLVSCSEGGGGGVGVGIYISISEGGEKRRNILLCY